MIVLIHSSKTMRAPTEPLQQSVLPELINKAHELNTYLQTMSVNQIAHAMHVSDKVAGKTAKSIKYWDPESRQAAPAIDSFIGDIYSGLKVHELNASDRQYANQHLRILSGLYGIVRPLDSIQPYRLEMGYRLPDERYKNLYQFWGTFIADTLPKNQVIINASAEEYTKAVLPYITTKVITPRFLTVSPKTGEPKHL